MPKTLSAALLTFCLVFLPTAGFAEQLPAKAKKLNAEEIKALYEGAHASFNNVRDNIKGYVFYSLKDKVLFGIYGLGSENRGIFTGKARVKGDQFCYKTGPKEVCQDVYRKGDTYYETNPDGTVTSIDTLQPTPPAVPTTAAMPAEELLKVLAGKRVFVRVFDEDKPLVAESNWETKKSRVSGKFIAGGKPAEKFRLKYRAAGDKLCFSFPDSEKCYSYHPIPGGLIEVNDKGAVHAISLF